MTIRMRPESMNPLKTNWLNLVPRIRGDNVLIYGVVDTDIVESLLRAGSGQIDCVDPDEKNRFRSVSGFTVVKNDSSLAKGAYSLVLIGDLGSLFRSNINYLEEIVSSARDFLKPGGALLVGTSNGLSQKLMVGLVLRRAGFGDIERFVCTPSFAEPGTIQSDKHDFEIGLEKVAETFGAFRGRNFLGFAKQLAKTMAVDVAGPFSSRAGLLYKVSNGKSRNEARDIVEKSLREGLSWEGEFEIVWATKPFTAKRVGLVKDGETSQLLAIIKRCQFSYNLTYKIREEWEQLSLLWERPEFFQGLDVEVPRPLFFEEDGGALLSVETAVSGTPLDKTDINVADGTDYVMDKLARAVEIQIALQRFLSDWACDRLPCVPSEFYSNVLGLEWPSLNDEKRLERYRKIVQHGDFTNVNLLCSPSTERIGVIDWEWLARGFPPMFDLYHLFFSVGFREKPRGKDDYCENYINSYIETFFGRNKLVELARDSVVKYCDSFGIDKRDAFDFFLDFMLFVYNKYDRAYLMPIFVDLHTEMIEYAMAHTGEFLGGGFTRSS